jgi:hypothetical protein
MMAPCDVILGGERAGVTGFGLAQALIRVGVAAEAESPYGSPQRLAGASPTLVDDIYSLAAIALELLIGTPKDPDQDSSRALREAQGLPERRRIQRPALHETRLFTTIAGVDAGKLRASFAAAFSEEPSARPSTAAEFVASFQDAMSSRRVTDEAAPSAAAASVVAVPSVSDETRSRSEEPTSAPVLVMERVEEGATLEPPAREERVVGEGRAARRRRARAHRREKLATSQPLMRESHEHEPRERAPESRSVRPVPNEVEGPEPIVDDALVADVSLPHARSIDDRSHAIPVQSGSRAFVVAAVVVVSFSAGFGGGFVAGHFSRPSTEAINVSRHEPVAEPQPTRPAVEDPKPVAATTETVAPISEEKVASAVDAGSLLVRSTPIGAGVLVDGESRGVTPLAVPKLAFGAHTIEVSHPGHNTRQQRVTLSERRPARSVDFKLRPNAVPAQATPAANSPGSLHVTSHPSGAQVFIDDDLIGTAPLLLSNVAAGSRRVRVELSGYKPWTTSVQIEPSTRLRVLASLEP